MIACSLAWSVTPASLVMDEGERRRLDEPPLLTCLGALSKRNEMSSSCGDTGDDAQDPRTPTTCASDACADVVASMTDAALQDMIVGAGKCTGELAQYKTFFTEDYLKLAVLGTASECGLPSQLSSPLDTCPGAIHKFSEMSSSCGDTGDDAQVPRTPTTCASDACAGVVASMTDAALQDMIVGAGKCTGELAQYKTFFTEDYLKRAVLGTASECGLTSQLSSPLDTCPGAITKFSEISSSCGGTGDDAQVPRTAEACASDACTGLVSSMTRDVVQRMSTGASKCTGDLYLAFQNVTASALTSVLLATASECGLTSPLIADVCSKANEGSPCGSIYSGKTCQCTGRRRSRNLLFGTTPGASCWCA